MNETALPMRQLGACLPGTGIGGAGVHWNGQTWRFHPRDFTIRTTTIDRYGASAIPAGMTIQDWGITYDELEPYFDKFEYMAGHRRQGREPEGPEDRRAATSSRARARASSRSRRRPTPR